jgi:hypothetical protein
VWLWDGRFTLRILRFLPVSFLHRRGFSFGLVEWLLNDCDIPSVFLSLSIVPGQARGKASLSGAGSLGFFMFSLQAV